MITHSCLQIKADINAWQGVMAGGSMIARPQLRERSYSSIKWQWDPCADALDRPGLPARSWTSLDPPLALFRHPSRTDTIPLVQDLR